MKARIVINCNCSSVIATNGLNGLVFVYTCGDNWMRNMSNSKIYNIYDMFGY